jgi:hypothetical protein
VTAIYIARAIGTVLVLDPWALSENNHVYSGITQGTKVITEVSHSQSLFQFSNYRHCKRTLRLSILRLNPLCAQMAF